MLHLVAMYTSTSEEVEACMLKEVQ